MLRVILCLLFSLFSLSANDTIAQVFDVNVSTDNGDSAPGDGICDDGTGSCSLRAAMEEANALGGNITINLNSNADLTNSDLPTITGYNLTFNGNGNTITDLSSASRGLNFVNSQGGSISNVTTSGFADDAIAASGLNPNDISIQGVTVTGTPIRGIGLFDVDGNISISNYTVNNASITDGVIISRPTGAVSISSCNITVDAGAIIVSNPASGSLIQITNNNITSVNDYGITVANAFNNVAGGDISQNTVINSVGGILMVNSENFALSGNLLENNEDGVFLQNSDRIFIDSRFRCNSFLGIFQSQSNAGILPPTITLATIDTIKGVGDAGYRVRVYDYNTSNCPNNTVCQGDILLGSTIVDNAGNWFIPGNFAGIAVVATQSDESVNLNRTSAFSNCSPVAACPTINVVLETPNTCGDPNGSIFVDAAGATEYSINGGATWQSSPSFPNLGNGTYNVAVRDAGGCVENWINNPIVFFSESPTTTLNGATGTTCGQSNAQIIVGGFGGTQPYTYSIDTMNFFTNPVFSNLPSGQYFIQVQDANGCLGNIGPVGIGPTSGPTASGAVLQDETCSQANGLFVASVSGGTSPFSYSIDGVNFQSSPTFSNLTAGSYALIVQDGAGCTTTPFPFTIQNLPGPTIIIVNDTPNTCGDLNGSIFVDATGATEYSIDGGATWQSSPTFSNLGNGTYNISVRDAGGCVENWINNPIVFQSSTPLPVLIQATVATCGQNNAQIIAGVITGGIPPYEYSLDGVNYQSNPAFSNVAPGTYNIRVRDSAGCVGTLGAITIISTPPPTASATIDQQPSCGQATGGITVSGTLGNPPYTYSIDGVNFQSSPIFTGLAPGTYQVVILDAVGCQSAPLSVILTDQPAPVGNGTVTQDASCGLANGRFTASATGGTPPYTYSIDGVNFQSSPAFPNLAAGSYTLIVRDASNCDSAPFTFTIQDLAGPTINAVTDTPNTCGDPNGSIFVDATGAVEYSIDGGVTWQSSPTFPNLGNGTYTITVRDASGCTAVFNGNPIIFSSESPVTSVGTIIGNSCGLDNGSITVVGTGGTPPYEYTLDGTNFQSNPVFNNLAPGTYFLQVRDAVGCLGLVNPITIGGLPPPVASATIINQPSCGLANGAITASASAGRPPYTYSIDGVNFQSSPDFTGLLAGTYQVIVRDDDDCESAPFTITLVDQPPPTANGTVTQNENCGLADGIFTASGSGGVPPYTYSIDGITFQASPIFSNLPAGSYSLIVKDAGGCDSSLFPFTIQNIPGPTVGTTVVQDATCGQANGIITTVANGGTPPYQYALNGGAFQASPIFPGLPPGIYDVTIQDLNGCTSPAFTVTVGGVAAPIASGIISQNASCGLANGSIIASGSGGPPPFEYSIDGTTFQANPFFDNLIAGTYNILVRDASGCVSAPFQIVLPGSNPPNGSAIITQVPTCGQANGVITASGNGGNPPYTYSIDGVSFQPSPIFNNLPANTYQVIVRDANGCDSNPFIITLPDTPDPVGSATIAQQPACGQSNGVIIASGNLGTPPYEYSLDGVTFQALNTFDNLSQGNYNVFVRDINGCISTPFSITLIELPGPDAAAVVTQQPACGQANGIITAAGNLGTPPYEFSLDGVIFQGSNTFDNLSQGSYNIFVRDINGCISSPFLITLVELPGPDVAAVVTQQPACGQANGIITAAGSGGTPPYEFSLDGITFQASDIFNGLSQGSYNIFVRDINGCLSNPFPISLIELGAPAAAAVVTQTPNCGQSNGIITAAGNLGTPPYEFSLDGITFQASDVFNNLPQGSYTIFVRDVNGCISPPFLINLPDQSAPIANAVILQEETCGQMNGALEVTGNDGAPPYEYSIDSINFQTTSIFDSLSAGIYVVYVRDANGCLSLPDTVEILDQEGPTANGIITAVETCGQMNGALQVLASDGTPPYEFSLDSINFQTSPDFNGLSVGTYFGYVRDSVGCISDGALIFIVGVDSFPLVDTLFTQNPSCGLSNGVITATGVDGRPPYQYSIDGGLFQSDPTFDNLPAGTYEVVVRDANACISDPITVVLSGQEVPTASATVTQVVNCGQANGEITASGSGGVSPYEYALDLTNFQSTPVFSGLTAGTYQVYIRDANGCISEAFSVVLTGADRPIGFATQSIAPPCPNQATAQIDAGAMGGVPPYEYSIDGGLTFQTFSMFSNLSIGGYVFVVRDSTGCTSTPFTLTLVSLSNIESSATVIQEPSCGQSNGSIQASASLGDAPYEYSLDSINFQTDPVFDNLAPGIYQVYAQDTNGCISNGVLIELTDQDGPTLTATVTQDASCGLTNGIITAIASGGTGPYQYTINGIDFQDSGVFDNLPAGTYLVGVQDAVDCGTFVSNLIVENLDSPEISVEVTERPSCLDSTGIISVSATGGTPPYEYSIDGVNFQSSGVFDNLAQAVYPVVARDAAGCLSVVDQIFLRNLDGPAVFSLGVQDASCGLDNGFIDVRLTNGAIVGYSIDNGLTFQDDPFFGGLSPGLYQVVVQDSSGCTSLSFDFPIGNQAFINATAEIVQNTSGGLNNGIISAQGLTGLPPYEYSIDGINFQTDSIFMDLAPGTYDILVRDSLGCLSDTLSLTLSDPDPNQILVSATTTTLCGQNDGTITVTASGGTAPYEYSIDGITFQASPVFAGLSTGNYTIIVRDSDGRLSMPIDIFLDNPNPLTANGFVTAVETCGQMNGAFEVIPSGGTPPYTYSLDSLNFQTSPNFSGFTVGSYQVYVRDSLGCTTDGFTVFMVGVDSFPIVDTLFVQRPTCNTPTGSVTITGVQGRPPFLYSINGGSLQADPAFNDLAPGTYEFQVFDANACFSDPITVDLIQIAPNVAATITQATSCGLADGVITASASGVSGPFEYSLDGVTFQSSAIFTGLAAGAYQIFVRGANGCISEGFPILLSGGVDSPIIDSIQTDLPDCNIANGQIVPFASNGTPPYTYSIDGGLTFQGSSIFTGLSSDDYTIIVQDATGCLSEPLTINLNGASTIVSIADSQGPFCTQLLPNGFVLLEANGGVGPYEYSLSGSVYQSDPLFEDLGPGVYQFFARDAAGCVSLPVSITFDPYIPPAFDVETTAVNCDLSDGTILITVTDGFPPYEYSIDGGNTYQSSNFFDGLSIGDYFVFVRDVNGCRRSTNVSIVQTSGLDATVSLQGASCGAIDGQIIISGSGGLPPYEYSIDSISFQSNSVFTVGPGVYPAYIRDASGCTILLDLLNIPEGPVILDFPPRNAFCGEGGILRIRTELFKGVQPFEWSTDGGQTWIADPPTVFTGTTFSTAFFPDFPPGTYVIQARDALGCETETRTVTIEDEGIEANILTSQAPTCGQANGIISAEVVNGLPPFEYSIDGGNTFQTDDTFFNLGIGSYIFIARDSTDCRSMPDTIIFSGDPPIEALAIIIQAPSCTIDEGIIEVVASQGIPPYSYSIDGGLSFQSDSTFNNLSAGDYTIFIQDAAGCTGTTLPITLESPEQPVLSATVTSPPSCGLANGVITLNASQGTGPFEYAFDGSTFQSNPEFDGIGPGLYTALVRDANGCISDTLDVLVDELPEFQFTIEIIKEPSCNDADGQILVTVTGGQGPFLYRYKRRASSNGITLFQFSGSGLYHHHTRCE